MRRCLLLCGFLLAAHGTARSEQPARDADGLTAYRPQQGVGYTTFARTAVPDHLEEDPLFGPGIRVNQVGEEDVAVEDDLIEVVARPAIDAALVLKRSHSDLSVWRTRDKRARREIAFTQGRSTPLALEEGEEMSLWVEWTGGASEFPVLSLHALGSDVVVDRIVFHSFASLVVALGGEGQVPQIPVDPRHGTFQVATSLYEAGWDVLMTNEDHVAADGSGRVYNEVVNAIENRSVRELAIFGYSHGGGSTYDLCARLNSNRAEIGAFSIAFTSYVDGVRNLGADFRPEERRPPMSRFHVNQYQKNGPCWGLARLSVCLTGGPVGGSLPPPTGLHVAAEAWGAGVDHYSVDNLQQVIDRIYRELSARVSR